MRSDPGGVFASDEHRRVMAALANPDEPHIDLDGLMDRIGQDDHLDLDRGEAQEILSDLEADGHALHRDGKWRNSKRGWDVLTDGAPVGGEN